MKHATQIQLAQAGTLSPALLTVAEAEQWPPEELRKEVAAGRVVIPANRHHHHLSPIGIGRRLRTKINANIGNSSIIGSHESEIEKLRIAVKYGADTVMDLGTGSEIGEIRRAILAASPVPIGTVPIYHAACQVEKMTDMTPELLLEVIAEQAEQGVDYMTIHAGLLREHLPAARTRLMGIVSRGGALTAQWMQHHQKQNPAYTHFDDILDICLRHDVTLSLGDGLRPGCLADASDEAQFAELGVLGELVRRCRQAGVQAMVEGPGHIPLDQIQENMRREREVCDDAPFYILGPVVADCAPGYDHITSAIGAALGAWHGAAMLCYVTPKEHLGLPNHRDVRDGVVAYKIAAHAADIAKGIPGSRQRDDDISRARIRFDWEAQFALALDPDKARELRAESLQEQAAVEQRQTTTAATSENNAEENAESHDYCTMCGPKLCSMRVFREIQENPNPPLRNKN